MAKLFEEMSTAVQARLTAQATFIETSKQDAIGSIDKWQTKQNHKTNEFKTDTIDLYTKFQGDKTENFNVVKSDIDRIIGAIVGVEDDGNGLVDTLTDLNNYIQDNEDKIKEDILVSTATLKATREEYFEAYGDESDFSNGIGAAMPSAPVGVYTAA